MLEAAIDQKMEDQAEFVRWWAENVKKRGKRGKGKTNEKNSTGPRYLFVEDAERLTDIKHQQVSKWRRRTVARAVDLERALQHRHLVGVLPAA